jgi:hypothetical protein
VHEDILYLSKRPLSQAKMAAKMHDGCYLETFENSMAVLDVNCLFAS